MGVTHETLSDVIGRIYDCALDPGCWPTVLGEIAGLVEAPIGMVAVHDLEENRPVRTYASGMPLPALWLYEARYAARNPIALALRTRHVEGAVEALDTLVDSASWTGSRMYREFMRPLRLGDVLGVAALRSGKRGVWLGAVRRKTQPVFGPEDFRLFRLLAPHVVRAMRLSDILELRAVETERLTSVLDRLATAVWVVDEMAQVLHANVAAMELLLRVTPLRVVRDQLTAAEPSEASLLADAIRQAAIEDFSDKMAEASLALGDGAAGAGLIATVLPLRGVASATCALVVAQDPAATPVAPLAAFGALHGMTAAELRCLGEIAVGRNVPETAAALGLAASTVRCHLNSIFAKTGASSQAELVRLVASFAPPVRG